MACCKGIGEVEWLRELWQVARDLAVCLFDVAFCSLITSGKISYIPEHSFIPLPARVAPAFVPCGTIRKDHGVRSPFTKVKEADQSPYKGVS